ncbi:hypothetical protein [Vibrio splendidus]|uniref:hypothetical protein n=1 Tax=Vibrio splendidus TaxID=29497 RepID=UPI003D0AE3B2
MDYNYTITLDKNRVIQTLIEQGDFLNGSITGELLVTDTPIANDIVDELRLIPQRHAASYYSLHFLKEKAWGDANPNGFENTLISSVKFDGELNEVEKLAIAPERFSLQSNSFQDFIENNDGISLIVDHSKKVSESECWKPSSILQNPLIPKYELSSPQVQSIGNLQDALNKTNGSSENIAAVIRQKGIESLFELSQSVDLKLAFQYSQGRVVEIPNKIHEGAKFLKNEELTRLADSYISYKAKMRRDSVEPRFSDFLATNKESINGQLEAAVELQVNLDLNSTGIKDINGVDAEYIEEMATKLYKQLNPDNSLMGLEYHLGVIEEAYKNEFVPDREALDVQLELLMEKHGEHSQFDKWLLNRINALELQPYLEVDGTKQILDRNNGLDNDLFYEHASAMSIPDLTASLVTASNRTVEKVTDYVYSDILTPSSHTADTYAELINDFTSLSIELAEKEEIDIEQSNQIIFKSLNGYIRSQKPIALGHDELEISIANLGDRVANCPITSPNADGTQRLSLRDIKAIVLPEAETDVQKVDQMLAIEKLNAKGFAGETLIYDKNEPDGKAQAVHNFASSHESVTKQKPITEQQASELNNQSEPLSIEQANRILDEIVANHPYLHITSHNTPLTLDFLSDELKQKADALAGVAHGNSMHIVLSHRLANTEESLRKTVAHESVHLGLRKMMNTAEHAELMEKVWKTMPENEKASLVSEYDHLNQNKPKDRRALAEEWLATRGEEFFQMVDPVVTETIKGKIQNFQKSITDTFKFKSKENQYDKVVKEAIKQAGQYNSIIDGKVENGLIVRTAGEFTHQSRSSDHFRNFKENQASGISHSSEVLIAAKKNFIHKYGIGAEERFLEVKFDSVDHFAIEGSQLVLPINASLEDCLEAVKTVTDSITDPKVEHESTNVSSPAEVKSELGNIEASIKPATSHVEQQILMALNSKDKQGTKEQSHEVSINNVEHDIDFGRR